jgi:hypothetical protein
LAIIATLQVLEPTIGQHDGAARQRGFDCKMVNEVQMERLRDPAGGTLPSSTHLEFMIFYRFCGRIP